MVRNKKAKIELYRIEKCNNTAMFLRIRMVWFIFLFLLPFTKLIAQKTKVSQLQNAEIEIMQSNYTGSILLLNEEIKKNPDHHLAYFLRGLAKKELGDNLGAYNDFSNSILLHPGFSKAYYHRCILKIDFKDYYNALSDINKALSYQVTNTDYYVARGYIYNILKDTTNALHDYNTAIFLDANNHNAYLNKSLLELNMKQYEKALSSINKSISIFPFSMNAFVIRGYIRLNSSDTAGAISDYEFAISKDSTFILAYYNLALYYHNHKDLQKAFRNYNKVIELNPYHAECLYNRAALYAENEKFVEAIADYNMVIKINPSNIYAYFNRAIVKQYLSDYVNSISDLTKVIDLYPRFQKAYVLRSNMYMQIKNYKQAQKDHDFAQYLAKHYSDSSNIQTADSVYLMPLLDFRSEFQALDTTAGHIQFKPYKLELKDIYEIQADNDDKKISNYNNEIDNLNHNKLINFKLKINNTPLNINYDNIAESKTLFDSLSVKIKTDSQLKYIWNSVLSSMLKNFKEANEYAMQINDTSDYAYLAKFHKANIYLKLGEQDENDNFETPFADLSQTSEINKNYSKAIEEYTESLLLNNKFSYAYYNRAYAKSLINDISGAITDFSSCIYFDNNNSNAYYNRGLLFVITGDYESACRDFSKAGELGLPESYALMYRYCK